MNETAQQSCLEWQLDRYLDQAALAFQLDEQLGTHHGLSWSDFVLLAVLDRMDGAAPSPELAGRLGLTRARLLLQLLPLEKIGLVARDAPACGKRNVTLRPIGRRLLREARETAADVATRFSSFRPLDC